MGAKADTKAADEKKNAEENKAGAVEKVAKAEKEAAAAGKGGVGGTLHDWSKKDYTNGSLLKPAVDIASLPHCPDMVDRKVMWLNHKVVPAVPYPAAGFNCNKDWA